MSRNQKSGFTRQPRVADQMTPDLIACVEQGLAAERAGDARVALEWHRAVPMFRRGQHRYLLEQIASFDGAMPDWLWARWIAYQTARCEDGATGQRMLGALKAVTEIVHPDLLERCFRKGGDPIRVTAQVVGESWAFHQYVVHEAGGLRSFIREHATGELAAHTALAEEWAGAPMSGYEIGASSPGARIAVREAGSLGWTGVLDLGAGTLASRDGWVIGRLVPSGVDDLLMFDMPPLGVPEKVARAVASPGDDWLAEVAIASRTGVLRSARILREDHEVVTDVQGSGYDDVSVEVLSRAVDGDLPPGDQARVAAAVLNPRIQEEVRRQLVRPGHPEAWVTWAARTPNPARGRLLALAHAARASA